MGKIGALSNSDAADGNVSTISRDATTVVVPIAETKKCALEEVGQELERASLPGTAATMATHVSQ